jgi:hypothetical protein
MDSLPKANAVTPSDDIEKIRSQVRLKFSGELANDTKWNELINYMRSLERWRPSYRYKYVNGFISRWDVEWEYHLPFPFVGVEWFDIGVHEQHHVAMLLPMKIIDHTQEIAELLKKIGFDFEVKGDVARVWGYYPKSHEDFPAVY